VKLAKQPLTSKISTKKRILSAAQQVFSEQGFKGASTREIAARASVNISSLHYHWESKEVLFTAILTQVQDQLVARLKDVVGEQTPKTPIEARRTVEVAMGAAFDFFAEDLTVPRLLMRRMIDGTEGMSQGEREALDKSWATFLDWTRTFTGGKVAPEAATFYMVTIQSVVLVLMLDSPMVSAAIGGSIEGGSVHKNLRRQVIALVEKLFDVDEASEKSR
jgi:AcrR family transcriptional regulator